MLFNSIPFFLLFLPVALLAYFALAPRSLRGGIAWLGVASLLFYAWWDWRFLGLLAGSIIWNYAIGMRSAREHEAGRFATARRFMALGVAADLVLLGFFKYFGFFVQNLRHLGLDWSPPFHVALPLGISFFTFTQIAFLVDAAQGRVRSKSPVSYLLFVTYFPHLIAGPILHHAPMIRQFEGSILRRPSWEAMSTGLLWFTLGLLKKVLLADGIQAYVAEAFGGGLGEIGFSRAWQGGLAYAFQIYFDFSGYTDMAIGISLMMGVKLPFNFESPYKATSVIEFWRRWHISLSSFLRDYVYIPLGGSRKGPVRRYTNLMATMLIGGIWHGAGWSFLLWGFLHGIYLVLNHAWRKATKSFSPSATARFRPLAWLITFIAVVAAWIPFRLENLDASLQVLKAMFGFKGVTFPNTWGTTALRVPLEALGASFSETFPLDSAGWPFPAWLLVCGGVAFLMPNSRTIAEKSGAWVAALPEGRARAASVLACGGLFALSLLLIIVSSGRGASEFLYFNF